MLARRLPALALSRRSPLLLAHRLSSSIAIPGTPRVLTDVAKTDLLEGEPPARVSALWEGFHDDKQFVAGVSIDPSEYNAIADRGGESPTFVFPVRRDNGHFMLFSQYSTAQRMFVFTFLEDYRKNPAMAQPWASVHLFDELIVSKGLGLLRAEVASERLTTPEAAHLLLLVRRYYGTDHYDKAWQFNHFQQRFDLDAYLAACP